MNLVPFFIFLGLVITGGVIGLIVSYKSDIKRVNKFKKIIEEKMNEQRNKNV